MLEACRIRFPSIRTVSPLVKEPPQWWVKLAFKLVAI
jgi:hypothetical protein